MATALRHLNNEVDYDYFCDCKVKYEGGHWSLVEDEYGTAYVYFGLDLTSDEISNAQENSI